MRETEQPAHNVVAPKNMTKEITYLVENGVIAIVKASCGVTNELTLIGQACGGGEECYFPTMEINIYGSSHVKALRDLLLKHIPINDAELAMLNAQKKD